jgi:hypothetical protein
MEVCCERNNEPSGSIKCGELSGLLEELLAFQEGLCSMELASWHFTLNFLLK